MINIKIKKDTSKHLLDRLRKYLPEDIKPEVEEFYLTTDGIVITDFANSGIPEEVNIPLGSNYPNGLHAKAVSFPDLNKDGLKDVIIIASSAYDDVENISRVYFQNNDGTFNNDIELNIELNISEKNTDIEMIKDYLSNKF